MSLSTCNGDQAQIADSVNMFVAHRQLWRADAFAVIIISSSSSSSSSIVVVILDRFYIGLFSALEQTHCAHFACDSKWVTVFFYSAFLFIFILCVCVCVCLSPEVVCQQRYWVVAWLVPRETAAVSAQALCTPCNHALVYSVTSFKATYVGCMCVYL